MEQNLFQPNNNDSTNIFASNQNQIPQNQNPENQQQQIGENDQLNEETKQALMAKREQHRVEMRKKLTDQKLGRRRLKFLNQDDNKQIEKQYTEQECNHHINLLKDIIQSQNLDMQALVSQLEIIQKMTINQSACAIFNKDENFFLIILQLLDYQESLNFDQQSASLIQSSWIISNLSFYDTFPYDQQQFLEQLLTKLFKLLAISNISVISIAMHAISNIITDNKITRDISIEKGILKIIQHCFDNKQFNMELLITFSQIIHGMVQILPVISEEMKLIQGGIIELIRICMTSQDKIIRQFSVILLSNLCSLNQDLLDEIFNTKIIEEAINKLPLEIFEVKREYVNLVQCILSIGKHHHFNQMLKYNIIPCISIILKDDDPQAIVSVVKSLELLWNYGQEYSENQKLTDNLVAVEAEKYNIPILLSDLQTHPSLEVYKIISSFLQNYFECE